MGSEHVASFLHPPPPQPSQELQLPLPLAQPCNGNPEGYPVVGQGACLDQDATWAGLSPKGVRDLLLPPI